MVVRPACRVFLAVLAVGASFAGPLVACGDQASHANSCPNDVPPSCPSPEPSWKDQVQAIVDTRCNGCHGDGGIEQSVFNFATYDGVRLHYTAMLGRLSLCQMPPADAAAPTPAERQALLGWLVCRAPNN
jgi:hypothetical protein